MRRPPATAAPSNCDPDYAEAHNNLAMALLAQGDMAAGWPEYEWRWKTPQMATPAATSPNRNGAASRPRAERC